MDGMATEAGVVRGLAGASQVRYESHLASCAVSGTIRFVLFCFFSHVHYACNGSVIDQLEGCNEGEDILEGAKSRAVMSFRFVCLPCAPTCIGRGRRVGL